MLKIYGDKISGNCYKVALLCSFLGLDFEWKHVNVLKGETRTDEFRAMNPNQKIPVVVLDNGESLWESNAILNYLAVETDYLPSDSLDRARVLQWQFFEQYSHEPYIAVARFINKYLGLPGARREEFLAKQKGGNKALALMDKHLSEQDYFVGSDLTIADISLFAYTHVAHEGGFDLGLYPNIQDWISRIKAKPKFITMEQVA